MLAYASQGVSALGGVCSWGVSALEGSALGGLVWGGLLWGGVYSGGVCSGGHLLPGGLVWGGSAPGGVVCSGGVGVSAPGGHLLPGGSGPEGVCSGGVWSRGVVSQHALRQTLPPPWTESQTPVKTLPWPNFVAAGKYALPRITYSLACCTTYKIKLLPKFQLEFSW